MRFTRCALVVSLGCAAACAPRSHGVIAPSATAVASVRVQVGGAGALEIVEVPLEEYVEATIVSEFAPGGGAPGAIDRMLDVQAVISRTYAVAHRGRHARDGFDLCATTHCQLYQPARLRTSRWAAPAAAAVRRTAGAVLWYEGRPAEAVFHADCGGHTSAAVRVWGGTTAPYLRAVRDDGPAAAAHAAWVFEAGFDEVRDALNADPRTRVGARLDWIRIVERDEAGRVALAAVQGERHPMVTGDVLRDVLSRTFGSRSIRSTWFDVARDGSRLRFSGRGFGHGVGLCQAGALARIRAGARPAEVLAVYFPGTTIAPLQP